MIVKVGIGGCVAGGIYPDKITLQGTKESFITAIKSGQCYEGGCYAMQKERLDAHTHTHKSFLVVEPLRGLVKL